MPPSVRFEELNSASLAAGQFDKAIVPIGSCEGHGDHLPFGTDAMIAQDLALAVAGQLEGVMVLPPTWFGMSHHYRHQPMCVSLSRDTTIALYRDVLTSLGDWGFRKILVVNGHDGNIPCIDVAAQDLKIAHPDVGIAVLDAWWTTGLALLPKETWDRHAGYGHGGEAETSIALAIRPDLVEPAKARGMVDAKDPHVHEFWNYQELTAYGATGDGRAATADKGARMKQVLVDYLVDFIRRKDAAGWTIPRQEA